MAQSHDNSRLLDILQGLYIQLANQITALRVASYRSKVPNARGTDLVTQLHDYIRQTPAPKTSSAVVQENNPSNGTGMESAKSCSKAATSAVPNSLSQAFCKRHPVDALQNSVSDKLVCSAWDHLHASLRCARAGDTETAQLHVSIMGTALKEAEHYLDDKNYKNLVKCLSEKISGLNRQ